jgi:HEAT repeats
MAPNQELDNLSLDDLIRRFRAPSPDPEEAALYFGELAIHVQQYGEPGLDFLLAERPAIEQDEDRLRALLLGLTYERRDDATVRAILLEYLDDARPLIVMDALDALRYWRVSDAQEQGSALSQHPSPYVRGGVVRYMAGVFPNEATELLLAALYDEHFIVRESAIDAIDDEGLKTLLPAVRPLLEDVHPDVRGAAQWALMDDSKRMQDETGGEESAQGVEVNPDKPG